MGCRESFLLFLLFCVFVWVCIILPWWGTILLVFVVFGLLVWWGNNENEKEKLRLEEHRKQRIERLKREKIAKENKIQAYESAKNTLVEKYGKPTNCIAIEENDINKEIIIFEEAKRIWLCGYDLPFSAILACRLIDNVDDDDEDIEIDTSVDSDDMLGRALVGGALFGSVGAVVGGVTAKQKHTIHSYSMGAYHEYKIHITIDDLETPLVVVELDDEEEMAGLIMSSMRIIIERNRERK